MKCPACNADNPDNATFCKSCGKALRSNLRQCPNGHDYDASLSYCPHCPPPRGENRGMQETVRSAGMGGETKKDTGPGPEPVNPKPEPVEPSETKEANSDKTVILKKPVRGDETRVLQGNRTEPEPVPAPTPTPYPSPGEKPPSPDKPKPQGNWMLTGWLVTFDLDPMGQDFKIHEGRHMIGSSDRSDMRIDIPGVSKEHATLLSRQGQFIIQDNLSANGTFVNGQMIEDRVYLKENDIIRIGSIDLKLKLV